MQQRTQPGFLAAEMFNRVVFGDASRRRACRPTPQSLDAITPRRDGRSSISTHYVPDHAAIAFAGDITLADARKAGRDEARRLEEGGRRRSRRSTDPAADADRRRST